MMRIISLWFIDFSDVLNLPVDERFPGLLDECESTQCKKFYLKKDSNLYYWSHTLRRMVLSYILGIPNEEIRFGTGKYGKPFIVSGETRTKSPFISFSHAGSAAALAVDWKAPVGVDILDERYDLEYLHDFFDVHLSKLQSQVDIAYSERDMLSFAWVRIEAVSKWCGLGVTSVLSKTSHSSKERFCNLSKPITWMGCNEFLFSPSGYHGCLIFSKMHDKRISVSCHHLSLANKV
ncbi:hypothetical protein HMPREF0682_1873 [Propionibacterium acidifaciens F0233]|uniref:4'-phosphopantetheinyl transferase N-terminal domain-containing protein n=2 Tax=Propionibacterium acidifaciens TaxID=556499 RepID=U2S7G0_9ACTN|nr:hypothetical protein [Propionibacterium acidifaciens]ERK61583.1 hypothetical protein HMPREF0682_1873 [Propionibacterium acidifaciens F0233]